ncbi:MAG: AAA family ATPase, partial [Ignavibacteria bacterium]|nr:AAA family ATPase [Ignavibacteria bacterium]
MYKREINKELEKWLAKKTRKPLILRGARQVGKTTLVNQFSERFRQYIYLNMDLPEERAIFENANSFNELIEAIFFLKSASKNE